MRRRQHELRKTDGGVGRARTPTLLLLCLSLCILISVHPVRAHIGDQYYSVHFNSGEPDFGTPPRRAVISWLGERDVRPLTTESMGSGETETEEAQQTEFSEDKYNHILAARLTKRKKQLRMVRRLEQARRWHEAYRLCAQIGKENFWDGDLRDHTEALRRVQAMRMPPSGAFLQNLQRYLHGLALDEAKKRAKAQQAFQHVYADPSAGFLREHALYQTASLAYAFWDFPRAVTTYRRLLNEFPQSVKSEAALIMIARCALLPQTAEGRRPEDGKWALAQLRKRFPQSRFRHAIIGLQGRIYFLAQQWPQALHCYFVLGDMASVEKVRNVLPKAQQGPVTVRLLAGYLKKLARVRSYPLYRQTVYDIDRAQRALSPADARRFSDLLVRDGDAASSYFYYRLYHCENKPRDLARLAQLADRIVGHRIETRLAPSVRIRLAEVYYQRRQYPKALRWAESALDAQPADRSLYVAGATLQKLKRNRAAIQDFTALLREYPHSPLRHAAQEELAILYEAVGDYGRALDQYFLLDYKPDIAYLLDVRMTPRQIEAFLQTPEGRSRRRMSIAPWFDRSETRKAARFPQRNIVSYSLGIRYMRAERWREAETWLRRIPHGDYIAFSRGRHDFEDKPSPYPLAAIRELSRLHRAVLTAKSDHARAEALFGYGDYYSTHGLLLLYNPALWIRERAMNFAYWWNSSQATRQDERIVRDYMYQHESYARARHIYLSLARTYPRSRYAAKALYHAACDARRLANFNGWWDKEDKRHNLWNEAIHLMRQTANRYPRSSVAGHARKYAGVFLQERNDKWSPR